MFYQLPVYALAFSIGFMPSIISHTDISFSEKLKKLYTAINQIFFYRIFVKTPLSSKQ